MCDVDWSWIQIPYCKNRDDICYDTVTKQMFKDMFCFDISDNKSNVLMFYKYFMRVLKASCLLHNPNSRQFNLRTCVYS